MAVVRLWQHTEHTPGPQGGRGLWTFREIHGTLPRGGRGLWTFREIHRTLPPGGRGLWTLQNARTNH